MASTIYAETAHLREKYDKIQNNNMFLVAISKKVSNYSSMQGFIKCEGTSSNKITIYIEKR